MPVKLTITPPRESSPKVIEFDDTRVSIGRSSSCDIRLPFRIVSGHHLTIVSDDAATYRVRDEASTNGTLLDGQPMAEGREYALSSGSRLDIVDLQIQVELVPLLGHGVSLDKTGTMVRQMLGEALLDGASDAAESAHFLILAGPERGEQLLVPDDLDSARVADAPGADLRVRALESPFDIFREGDGFGVRPAAQDASATVGDQPLSGPRQLASGDEIQSGPVRLRFVDPLESFLQELDGIVPSSSHNHEADAQPVRMTMDAARPSDADEAGQAPALADDTAVDDATPAPPNKNPESTRHHWGLVEFGVLAVSMVVLCGVAYLLLSIFGVL